MKDPFDTVIASLKEKGVRLTEARKAIISYLIQSEDHPSAEQIYKDLLPLHPSLSLATVYNNLKLLVETGFVIELRRKQDSTAYFDFMGHDHLNLICQTCGCITDLEMEPTSLTPIIEKETGFQIHREILTIYGICPSCQQK